MITSKKNPRLQTIRQLLQNRKERDETGLYVIEGVRLLEEAVTHNIPFQEVFFSSALSERGHSLLREIQSINVPVNEVDENVFIGIMDTENSQGIAAICRKQTRELPVKLSFAIVADQLRDPGNLGTLLRTAAAAGAQAVFTTPGSVDLYSPKVVRSAMGAHFHMHCSEIDWPSFNILLGSQSDRPKIFVAAADGAISCWNCDFTSPSILIIGSEADGASDNAFRLADEKVAIPMPGEFESLNAAVAAGILIFEVVRQRNGI